MHKIDSANSVTTMPTPGAAGVGGFFQNGNPATGFKGTTVSADWLNMVQSELNAFLTAAGITPSKASNAQVKAACDYLYGGAGINGAAGFKPLGTGLRMQWGQGTTTSAQNTLGYDQVAFPSVGTPFLTMCSAVVVSEANAGGGWSTSPVFTVFGPSNFTTVGFRLWCKTVSGGTVVPGAGVAYNYIALGH